MLCPSHPEIPLGALIDDENRAGLTRVTCGWKKPELSIDWVRRYWRDVHSPAIARRAGVYDYRHSQFDPLRGDLFAPLAGVDYAAPAGAQLMWLSDVRYLDEAALAEFGRSPDGEVKAQLLADIELIVGRSTTYKSVGENTRTLLDATGNRFPQGPVRHPSFAVFFRQRSDEPSFRECVRRLAARWAAAKDVLRVRLTIFDVPDMEAERKAGYPVKTHPVEQQYQAWIDLVLRDTAAARELLTPEKDIDVARHVSVVHAYPVRVVYTSVYGGRPTIVGLRGFAAYEAIEALGADNQKQTSLLEWMYGPIARGGAAETVNP
jgi:hypothetical protein